MSSYDPYAAEPSGMEQVYELLRPLGGDDGLASHLARERASGRLVVIEVARPRGRVDLDELERLHRTASALTSLEHPNLVPIIATFRASDGGVAVVRPFIEGRSVAEIVHAHGALPARTAAIVTRDVLRGLAALHVRGFLHRDVRAEHVYLDETLERAMLAGLSAARPVDGTTALGPWESLHRPPHYLAPEQVAGEMMDARSDVYGVGLVAWTMLTGRRPWDGESVYAIAAKQATIDLPSVAALRDDVPAPFERAIARALRKAPEERWPSARAMSIALGDGAHAGQARADPAAASAETSSVGRSARDRSGASDAARAPRKGTPARWQPIVVTASRSSRRRRSRRAWAIVSAVLVLLLVGGGGAFYVTRGDGGAPVVFASAAGTVASKDAPARPRPRSRARAKRAEPPEPSALARVSEKGPRVAAAPYTSSPIGSRPGRTIPPNGPRDIADAAIADRVVTVRSRARRDSISAVRADSLAKARRRAARDSVARARTDSTGGARRDSTRDDRTRTWLGGGTHGIP